MSDVPNNQIVERHFKLLHEFGKNQLRSALPPEHQASMWALACRAAGVAVIPHDVVREEWKKYITAESQHSAIAINGDVDPQFTSVGITYRGTLTAGHTTTTRALIKKLLRIFRRIFETDDEYMDAVRRLAIEAIQPPRRRKKK